MSKNSSLLISIFYCWIALIIFIFIIKVLHFAIFIMLIFATPTGFEPVHIPTLTGQLFHWDLQSNFCSVGPPRFELGTTAPKTVVLPLHHGPILNTGVLLHQKLIYSYKDFLFSLNNPTSLLYCLLHRSFLTPFVARNNLSPV